MASSASSSPSGVVSTDSYPANFRSFSTDRSDDGTPSIESEPPSADGELRSIPAEVPKLKWDKEQFDVRRPYERKNYEHPYRDLPGHLSKFEGLNVKPRKCTVTNPFTRRTPIEEVFHKRNVKSVCPAEVPRALQDCVEDVIVADNLSSQESAVEEDLAEVEKVADRRIVSRECCKTFFRARRALLRSQLFQEYFNRDPAPEKADTVADTSEDESEEGLDDLPEGVLEEKDHLEPIIPAHQVRSNSVGSYQPPTIVHRDDKVPVVEAQEHFLQRMKSRYLQKFDRVRQQLEDAERERQKPPPPFDPEHYEAEYPKPDIRDEAKAQFREALRNRLEELNQLQHRTVRKYPTSVKQFAAYKAEIMDDRRKLRDEALLVEDYYRNANTPKELPEAKLEVKRYRLAEFGVHSDDSEDEEDREANEQIKQNQPLVYHTCMTRDEWGHWIAHSTKIDKLKLPKVNVPRIPVLVQKCDESPIRAYIQGRLFDSKSQTDRKQRPAQPAKIIRSIQTMAARKAKVTMRDLLFDPAPPSEPMDYVPYNANLRPYSDIAEERFRSTKGQRKVWRQLRKSRMHWIEQLVDEICSRKRC
ncbi:uncharacterized protein LOC126568041 [Anopheles maculipalpis]|uniref:uncharacterized protein LOC126568041 n=1 Tax=Anopheles maculipalpis TaxID=1496333 RepID=UPI002158C84E|nr:uncharacterized protein LOC126568041 [Anopheles maculipalpis]